MICATPAMLAEYVAHHTVGHSDASVTIVDENSDAASSGDHHVEVVVVVAWDRQVPHPAVMHGRGRAADDDRDSAVGGLKMLIFR